MLSMHTSDQQIETVLANPVHQQWAERVETTAQTDVTEHVEAIAEDNDSGPPTERNEFRRYTVALLINEEPKSDAAAELVDLETETHEQRELPGGALGDAITTLNQNERHWRAATIGHDADPELKPTTVRWHTGPNGAGDPTTGWYILSHENDHEPKIGARTGPVRTDNLSTGGCSSCTAPTSTTTTC